MSTNKPTPNNKQSSEPFDKALAAAILAIKPKDNLGDLKAILDSERAKWQTESDDLTDRNNK
jgi:DNA-directed RNA polymerase subunit F